VPARAYPSTQTRSSANLGFTVIDLPTRELCLKCGCRVSQTEKASAAEAIQRFQEEVDGERKVRETLQAELEERPTTAQMEELRKKVGPL
jgi:hypothetical protein